MNQWDYGTPLSDDDDPTAAYPITWERDPWELPGLAERPERAERLGLPERPGDDWPDEDWPPRYQRAGRGGRARWLVPALIVVASASAGAAVILTGGHPAAETAAQSGAARSAPSRPMAASMAPASVPPTAPAGQGPLTTTQAAQVLAGYTSANNTANAQRSDTELATIETGSSYAIDAGVYRTQQAENAATYPAFAPLRAQYYIPRETSYPRWFVAQVTNADLASPAKAANTEYLLFTQAAPGAAWQDAVEPYVVAGTATPAIALGADGLATPVTGVTSLAVPLGQIAQVTASSLDGDGPLPTPDNLADLIDQEYWRYKLPASSVTDAHAPDGGTGVFGLRTADGGALLFYTDAAELTLTAPAGKAMHLTIPGYYSPSQALSQADISYLEQFAAYDPPAGSSGLRVVADYSGITGT